MSHRDQRIRSAPARTDEDAAPRRDQSCHAEQHEAELRAYDAPLRAAAAVGRGDRVLDIGCGTGRSTRDAARAAATGRVLGIDISAQSLERARRLSAAERLDNITYEHGDAQSHPFAAAHYDLAISRFGVMFFSEPVAAFRNIARALRPHARLVLLVWQSRARNEWATAIDTALTGTAGPLPPAKAADPFSLGDRATAARVLEGAGFRDIRFEDVHEPVFLGPTSAAALEFVRGFQSTRDALAGLTAADTARALERLRDTLDDHRTADAGVGLDSRAWMITAQRN